MTGKSLAERMYPNMASTASPPDPDAERRKLGPNVDQRLAGVLGYLNSGYGRGDPVPQTAADVERLEEKIARLPPEAAWSIHTNYVVTPPPRERSLAERMYPGMRSGGA